MKNKLKITMNCILIMVFVLISTLMIVNILDPALNIELDKKEMCLNSVQYEIGAYSITLNTEDQVIIGRDYKGTFKDLYNRTFVFECNLDTQEINYITAKVN